MFRPLDPTEALRMQQLLLARCRNAQSIQPRTQQLEVLFRYGAMAGNNVPGLQWILQAMKQLGTVQALGRRVDQTPFIRPHGYTADAVLMRMRAADGETLRTGLTVQPRNKRVALHPSDFWNASQVQSGRKQIRRLTQARNRFPGSNSRRMTD